MKFSITFTILLFHVYFFVFSQNKEIDSLRISLRQAKQDTLKARLNYEIGCQYNMANPDSAICFYNKAIELTKLQTNDHNSQYLYAKALQAIGWEFINFRGEDDTAGVILDKAFHIYSEIARDRKFEKKSQIGMASCYSYFGIINSDKGRYESALEYYFKSFKIFEKLDDKKKMASCYGNIGNIYRVTSQYDKAIEYFIKTLKIYEAADYKNGISGCYNNIGIIQEELNNFDKAIDYYLKALKLKEEIGDKKGMSQCYSNLCISYKHLKNYDKAKEYCYKALKIGEELGNKEDIAACYGNLGNICTTQKNYDKAIEYYLKSLKIDEELGDINSLSLVYGNISLLHLTIADSMSNSIAEKQNHYKEAINYGLKAIKLAQEIKATLRINEAASHLKDAYKGIGNTSKALAYAEIYIATRDSMFSEEKTKALTEMETKYQSEKKQLEIEKMAKQKELDKQTIVAKTAENRKQRILIISFVAGFILIFIFSILLYRLFLQKKKANILLAQQNTEIFQQKEEISTQRDEIEAQRDEIEAQRDLVTEQKERIEEIHKEVTDSITYARRIQEAVLPVSNASRSVLGEHFVFFKPKDIVSGDFYFTTKVRQWLIVAVADCTGHGVPGAFMSMLGISFLNEIVQKQEVHKANHVLNILRTEIINALQQKGVQGEQKDGMDISLLVINTDTNECQWAGANNPIYIVKKLIKPESEKVESEKPVENSFQLSDFQLDELKGDKMPIAIYPEMRDFTNHKLILEKGDCIYLFTDGFADQFGGPKGKKFMYKQLKELLIHNSHNTMPGQKEILETAFENWKGKLEQIDDVTVLGIRI